MTLWLDLRFWAVRVGGVCTLHWIVCGLLTWKKCTSGRPTLFLFLFPHWVKDTISLEKFRLSF